MASSMQRPYSELRREARQARPGSRARIEALSYLARFHRAAALGDPAIAGQVRRYLAGQLT